MKTIVKKRNQAKLTDTTVVQVKKLKTEVKEEPKKPRIIPESFKHTEEEEETLAFKVGGYARYDKLLKEVDEVWSCDIMPKLDELYKLNLYIGTHYISVVTKSAYYGEDNTQRLFYIPILAETIPGLYKIITLQLLDNDVTEDSTYQLDKKLFSDWSVDHHNALSTTATEQLFDGYVNGGSHKPGLFEEYERNISAINIGKHNLTSLFINPLFIIIRFIKISGCNF